MKKILEMLKEKLNCTADWTGRMKMDWNSRAHENAMHYIMTDKPTWSLKDFFASGEEDVKHFVDQFLDKYKTDRSGILLELGCGIGRLTLPLSERFAYVEAIDISEEMIKEARKIHDKRKNITFMVNNGKDLDCCSSGKYSMVFSYIVLQHIPDVAIIYNYFKEFGRVLLPGGLFLFQVANNDPKGHEKYLERWRYRREIFKKDKKVIPFEDHDYAYLKSKIENFETIVQTPVDYDYAIQVLREAGLTVEYVIGKGTDMMWLGGKKALSKT